LHSNYGSISYHFGDKAILVENGDFFIPSAFDVRGPHRNIAMFDMEQEAQLSQRHRAMPRVVEYFG